MSISESSRVWGPSHQYIPPPARPRKTHLLAWTVGIVVVFLALPDRHTLVLFALGVGLLVVLVRVSQSLSGSSTLNDASASSAPAFSSAAVRAKSLRRGGAYWGLAAGGGWVLAYPEHAVMVLGPPRSGKTGSIVIPSVLAAAGPVVSTATKPDVMDATWRARSEVGQVWLFDPSGERGEWPRGIRRLCWSAVPAAASWDGALLMARAMTAGGMSAKGTSNEAHWRERSTALLAPLLYAAF